MKRPMKCHTHLAPIFGLATIFCISGVLNVSAQTQATPPAAQQEQQSEQSPQPPQTQQPSTSSGGMPMQGMEHGRQMHQQGMEHGRGTQGMGPGMMKKEQEKK